MEVNNLVMFNIATSRLGGCLGKIMAMDGNFPELIDNSSGRIRMKISTSCDIVPYAGNQERW
jgi:hypothetical protein